ncbi:hypothetical protein EZS27_018870 [termite gut metagenome]|uniref:Uncharacterized protein n=1 Tax=termite gut metagenome TaxID=433724 RepID=A0A5J4RF26_9ZZZZ
MANNVENLWPEIKTDGFSVPKVILSKQAAYLGESTKNLLTAKVESCLLPSSDNPNGRSNKNTIKHRFIVSAPMLNYQFELLSVEHDMLASYPLKLTCDILEARDHYVSTEEQFIKALSYIFKDSKAQNVVRTLIAQSQ